MRKCQFFENMSACVCVCVRRVPPLYITQILMDLERLPVPSRPVQL